MILLILANARVDMILSIAHIFIPLSIGILLSSMIILLESTRRFLRGKCTSLLTLTPL